MDTYEDSYTRLVTRLKFALPLIALGILSTLFLFSRTIDPERAIPYAEVDVERMVREQSITAPAFSSVTRDGAAISISAEIVRPDRSESGRMSADSLEGRFDLPDGSSADVAAPAGTIDMTRDVARLDGGVEVETTTGYSLRTDALTARLDQTLLRSDGAVNGSGPAGVLEAGRMEISEDPGGGYVLTFDGGVRLVYDPGQSRE